MSQELSRSHALITEGATALELALARIVASLRAECGREIAACEADRRAARSALELVVEQVKAAQQEFRSWFDAVKREQCDEPLAGLVEDLRASLALEVSTFAAERKAVVASIELVRAEFKTAQAEFANWIEGVKQQRIELRGEKGEPGSAGPPGSPGEPGAPGIAGAAGRDGRDGMPGAPGVQGRDGIDGADGKDGRDGLGVSDFDVVYDGERKITLRWSNGDRQVERSFVLANMLYRGVWENGRLYEPHDVVTYGGSGFVAICQTKNRPEGDDWQLFVKRGLSGANGKAGERGPAGPAGKDGRDATQLGPHGGKW